MELFDQVHIAQRFQKSIRIDTDLCSKDALDGFICPQSSADTLLSMARHVSETNQGAFTWTGPYGCGKSSLAIALSALLSGDAKFKREAVRVFGHTFTNAIWELLPTGSKGWHVLPVVGKRDNPVDVIGEALREAGHVTRRPRGGWTEQHVINSLVEIVANNSKAHGGLILFVDEMGKFLEAGAQDGIDIYIFQQLAEVASRSNGRFLFIGILHQAFNEYAHRLSHEIRSEWIKIQGRFVDLPVNAASSEQIDLIARAIECSRAQPGSKNQSKIVAKLVHKGRSQDFEKLANTLEECWPLHPVVTCLLGPISRHRFGQNQRSIFGFLNSSEPNGFQDFLRSANENDLYTPPHLWDYLRANLEPSILASPDGHRWALAVEALERCESLGGNAFIISLLKTIALVDLFKERSGLVASLDLLKACFPGVSEKSLRDALNALNKWSLTIFKKFQDAYAIFAGSDFDIDQAVSAALEEIDELDFACLRPLAGLQPILAKRHYHETGAMRWFDVDITPAKEAMAVASHFQPKNGVIGRFLLIVPTEGENEEQVQRLCREVAKLSDKWDIVAGHSSGAWSVVMLARELLALDKVSNSHPELAGDPVARREVTARLADLQTQLEMELIKSFSQAIWYRKHHSRKQYRQSGLNGLSSELANRRYDQCPKLNNELLNRQKPSSSAIAGQNALLKHMIAQEGESCLGIDGYPAEGGLFSSLLDSTGLYAETECGWQFVSPSPRRDPCRLLPAWDAAIKFFKKNKGRSVPVSELYDLWAAQPFGIKEGLMPILSTAFILTQQENLAIYRDGIFRARYDNVDVESMAKDARTIQLRWMDFDGVSRNLLLEMSEIVRELNNENKLIHLEPIDVARGLVEIYEQLPNWTKRTMRLSTKAVQIRDMFKNARDPNKFLFDDIPALINAKKADSLNEEDLHKIVLIVKEGLQEIVQAYPLMMHRLKDMLLAELRVPNLSHQSLLELHERAENIKALTGDFRLNAFIGRIAEFEGDDASFESIASLAANKPPRNWTDPDTDRASIELVDMVQKFLKAETFTRIKGRSEKRQAMAVLIGMEGISTPLLEEFDVADSDKEVINNLIARVSEILGPKNTNSRSIILAALATLSAQYMQPPETKKKKMEAEGTHRIYI